MNGYAVVPEVAARVAGVRDLVVQPVWRDDRVRGSRKRDRVPHAERAIGRRAGDFLNQALSDSAELPRATPGVGLDPRDVAVRLFRPELVDAQHAYRFGHTCVGEVDQQGYSALGAVVLAGEVDRERRVTAWKENTTERELGKRVAKVASPAPPSVPPATPFERIASFAVLKFFWRTDAACFSP